MRSGRRRRRTRRVSGSRSPQLDDHAPRPRRSHRIRQVGARACARRRLRRRRDRLRRLDAGVPRARHRDGEADGLRIVHEFLTTCSTSPTRTTTTRSSCSSARHVPRSPASRREDDGRCSSGAPASTCRQWSTISAFRARISSCARSWRRGRRHQAASRLRTPSSPRPTRMPQLASIPTTRAASCAPSR